MPLIGHNALIISFSPDQEQGPNDDDDEDMCRFMMFDIGHNVVASLLN